jgi:uncharacterized protein YbjT (DUF2867 family)
MCVTILLTGATGKTGGATARALAADAGVKGRVRALVRNAEKAAPLAAAGIELVVGDVADPETLRRALVGVERALLVMPNRERQLDLEKQFVDLAKAAGVRHVVKMSSAEAVPGVKAAIPKIHVASEDYIKASGLAWTMLKPNFYMQNLLASARGIAGQGVLALPCGNGKTAMADTRDVGAVAAKVLTGDGHAGKSYELTGPELLTFADVAARLSEILGKPVRYVDQPMAEYHAILSRVLPDRWHADAVCELFGDIAHGGLDHTSDTVARILGRPPTSLSQFIRDHLAAFKG